MDQTSRTRLPKTFPGGLGGVGGWVGGVCSCMLLLALACSCLLLLAPACSCLLLLAMTSAFRFIARPGLQASPLLLRPFYLFVFVVLLRVCFCFLLFVSCF